MADGARKWDNLDTDCLSVIFSKAGLVDLSVSLPFVCRSWSAASLDPLCWKSLNLRPINFMPWSDFARKFSDRNSISRFTFSGFMKLAVRRSNGGATELRLPELGSMEDLILASDKCRRLKTLDLPKLSRENEDEIPNLISNWKTLTGIRFESKPSNFPQIAYSIGRICGDLEEFGIPCSSIKREDVSAIVVNLPKLKSLDLSGSILSKGDLVAILDGCGDLVRFNARNCVGFEDGDEEIMKRGCRIRVFEIGGSKMEDYGGYETDECDDLYVHVI